MAIMTAVNFLGVKMLAATNSAMTWWKIAVPLLTILVLALFNFHGSNFTAADGFNPNGLHGILLAVATSGIIFSYLGFEQADQLAGEAKNPKKDIPFAIIGSILIGMIIYILLQVAFLFALPAERDRQDLGRDRRGPLHHLHRPVRRGRHPAQPRLAGHDHLHRRRHLPGRHRPDLHRPAARGSPTACPATATSRRPSSGPASAASRGSA